jgi:hypothetical protein
MGRQGVTAIKNGPPGAAAPRQPQRPESGLQALANVPSKGYFNNAGIGGGYQPTQQPAQ